MRQRGSWKILAIMGLVVAILACNAPTPTPTPTPEEEPSPSPGGIEAQDTLAPTETPTSPAVIPDTPTPTEKPTESPTPTAPVSAGPLDFTPPTQLDHWEKAEDGEMLAAFTVEIIGGAPPYDLYHDAEFVKTTWQTDPQITFRARGCSGIVHTITVKSADGQTAKHDYWISPPWCEN